jgi:uncharacterized protein YkwD
VLIYNKLQEHEGTIWREIAEVLGTILIIGHVFVYIFLIGPFLFGFIGSTSSAPLRLDGGDPYQGGSTIPTTIPPTIPFSDYGDLFRRGSPTPTPPPTTFPRSPSLNMADIEGDIFQKVNAARTSNGLNPLISDTNLASIARGHSQDMAANKYFDHVDLQGQDPSARATKAGYNIRKDIGNNRYQLGIGEIIAKMPTGNVQLDCPSGLVVIPNTPTAIADATVDGWMNHDSCCCANGHRDAILSNTFTNAGVGVAYDGTYYISTVDFW